MFDYIEIEFAPFRNRNCSGPLWLIGIDNRKSKRESEREGRKGKCIVELCEINIIAILYFLPSSINICCAIDRMDICVFFFFWSDQNQGYAFNIRIGKLWAQGECLLHVCE